MASWHQRRYVHTTLPNSIYIYEYREWADAEGASSFFYQKLIFDETSYTYVEVVATAGKGLPFSIERYCISANSIHVTDGAGAWVALPSLSNTASRQAPYT